MTDVNLAGPESSSLLPGLTTGELGLRLKTLVRLRWLAVAGQTAAVALVLLGSGLRSAGRLVPRGHRAFRLAQYLPHLALARQSADRPQCGAAAGLRHPAIGAAALSHRRPRKSLRLPVPGAGDGVGDVAADQMDLGSLRAIAFVCASFLAFDHLPLPWFAAAPLELPALYVVGMWTALVCGVVFSAIYARRIAEEARQMSAACPPPNRCSRASSGSRRSTALPLPPRMNWARRSPPSPSSPRN